MVYKFKLRVFFFQTVPPAVPSSVAAGPTAMPAFSTGDGQIGRHPKYLRLQLTQSQLPNYPMTLQAISTANETQQRLQQQQQPQRKMMFTFSAPPHSTTTSQHQQQRTANNNNRSPTVIFGTAQRFQPLPAAAQQQSAAKRKWTTAGHHLPSPNAPTLPPRAPHTPDIPLLLFAESDRWSLDDLAAIPTEQLFRATGEINFSEYLM